MARAPRRRPIAAAVLALTGLVAGCSGGEDPVEPAAPEPTPTATVPSASPSPSPSAEGEDKPERPAAMEKHDAEGAAAAAEYFIGMYDYVMRTGDTSTWEEMSHDSCGFCSDAITQADRLQRERATWSGGEITRVEVTQTYPRDSATGIYPLDMRIEQAAATITSSDGEVLFEGSPETMPYRVEVGVVDNEWVVVEIAEEP